MVFAPGEPDVFNRLLCDLATMEKVIAYIRALEKVVGGIINGLEFDKEECEYRASMRLIADAQDALASAREAGK
jgi:hypothetical protein